MGNKGRRRINLALQGGGAHGAFTWGVLDRLLQDDQISFAWISATSAGAVNAAALASGLAEEGAAGARETLRRVWQAVEAAGAPDLLRYNPLLSGLARVTPMPGVHNMLSPYQFNPLGFDPLRRLLTEHIDFDRIRASSDLELLIAATDVATGRARLFRRAEISVEVILASACLPTLHHAVTIDGRAYWDGGFSANPDLKTLATESPVEDTLIVLLNPLEHGDVPRSAMEIASRVSAITFNQPFVSDVEAIVAAQESEIGWFANRHSRLARLKRHRFHVIEASSYTAELGVDSKLMPNGELLRYLFNAGREEAQSWLAQHRDDIGRRSTVDLRARYLKPVATGPGDREIPPGKVPEHPDRRAAGQ